MNVAQGGGDRADQGEGHGRPRRGPARPQSGGFTPRFRLLTMMMLMVVVAVSVSGTKWLIDAEPGISKAVTASLVVLAPLALVALVSLAGQFRRVLDRRGRRRRAARLEDED